MKAPEKEKGALSDSYRIFETDVFISDFDGLSKNIRDKLRKKLVEHVYLALKQQPYFGKNIKKLSNYSPPTWRYRVGDFRVFYTVNDESKIISILTTSDRKDAY